MLKIAENIEDNGIIFRAVVEGSYIESAIAHVYKDDVEEVTDLFNVIRNMGEVEFKATLDMIKKTTTYF